MVNYDLIKNYSKENKMFLREIRVLESRSFLGDKAKNRIKFLWKRILKNQETNFTQPITHFSSAFGKGIKKTEIKTLHRKGFLYATGYKPIKGDSNLPKVWVWSGNRY
jgi:hypothetical protein